MTSSLLGAQDAGKLLGYCKFAKHQSLKMETPDLEAWQQNPKAKTVKVKELFKAGGRPALNLRVVVLGLFGPRGNRSIVAIIGERRAVLAAKVSSPAGSLGTSQQVNLVDVSARFLRKTQLRTSNIRILGYRERGIGELRSCLIIGLITCLRRGISHCPVGYIGESSQ